MVQANGTACPQHLGEFASELTGNGRRIDGLTALAICNSQRFRLANRERRQ